MRKMLMGAFVVLGTWLLAACTPPAADIIFIVDTVADTVDANPGDGVCQDASGNCSLRAAVMEANVGAAAIATEIQLTGGQTYALTIPGSGEDAAATGDLDLRKNIYIRTSFGTGQATIDASGLDRAFHANGGSWYFLEGLDITGGDVAALAGNEGGGILLEGGLLGVEDSRVFGNAALNGGGVAVNGAGYLWSEDSTFDSNDASAYGGGIFSRSNIWMINTTITDNTVVGNGGGSYAGQLHLENGKYTGSWTTISGAATGTDGIVWQNAEINLSSSVVEGTTACQQAPGSGTWTSVGVIFSDATCPTGPGDLDDTDPLLMALTDNGGPVPTMMPYNQSIAVDGLSSFDPACQAAVNDARQQPRNQQNGCDLGALEVQPGESPDFFVVDTTADTDDAFLNDGECADSSGNCSLRAAVQQGNHNTNTTEIRLTGGTTYTLTQSGAGEDAAASGDLDLTELTLIQVTSGSGQATIDGGGVDRVFHVVASSTSIYNVDITGGNASVAGVSDGGGLRVEPSAFAYIGNTRVTGNNASRGGGVSNSGGFLSLTESTVDNNTALNFGGGIYTTGDSDLRNVTVVDNSSTVTDAEISVEGGDLDLQWSTVVGGSGAALDLYTGTSSLLTSGIDGGCLLGAGHTINLTVGNAYSDDACSTGFGDFINTPIDVASLAYSGIGSVPTMMPNIGSPLLENISFFDQACVATSFDARGVSRPQNVDCDIGAVEALVGEPA